MSTERLLEVHDLAIGFDDEDGRIELVEKVDLTLDEGESMCIVGESGSGKSLTLLAILGLLPDPLRVLRGSIRYRGRELTTLGERELRALRGRDIGIVFQDPMTSLNPVRRVGAQIARAIRSHDRSKSREQVRTEVLELIDRVGIRDAAARLRAYPHQWSGGMRQRAAIGMAIANSPSVLLADEPTTALDVTVQAQVVSVLAQQRVATGAAMIMVTHDLGLVAQIADKVAVMYAGRIVERGTVWDVFDAPAHPYTRGLLASLLTAQSVGQRAFAIPGAPPAPSQRGSGCPFLPRCTSPLVGPECGSGRPPLVPLGVSSAAACFPLVAKADSSATCEVPA